MKKPIEEEKTMRVKMLATREGEQYKTYMLGKVYAVPDEMPAGIAAAFIRVGSAKKIKE